jgi:hypothetical protein
MKLTSRKQRQVVNKLTHAGFASVIMQDFECEGDVWLNAEKYVPDLGMAGDSYAMTSEVYDDLGVNRKVADVLTKCNCYAEWVNGGQLVVVAN